MRETQSKFLKVIREKGLTKVTLVLFCLLAIVGFSFFILGSFLDVVLVGASSVCYKTVPFIPACGNILDISGTLVSVVLSFVFGALSIRVLLDKSLIFLAGVFVAVALLILAGGLILKIIHERTLKPQT